MHTHMSRKKPEKIPTKERQQLLREFWMTVSLLHDVGEIQDFFRDLLSEKEGVMFARRLKIAKLLLRGKSYGAIEREMKVSSATIASVHAWLDGGFGGYIKGVQRLERELRRQSSVEGRQRI